MALSTITMIGNNQIFPSTFTIPEIPIAINYSIATSSIGTAIKSLNTVSQNGYRFTINTSSTIPGLTGTYFYDGKIYNSTPTAIYDYSGVFDGLDTGTFVIPTTATDANCYVSIDMPARAVVKQVYHNCTGIVNLSVTLMGSNDLGSSWTDIGTYTLTNSNKNTLITPTILSTTPFKEIKWSFVNNSASIATLYYLDFVADFYASTRQTILLSPIMYLNFEFHKNVANSVFYDKWYKNRFNLGGSVTALSTTRAKTGLRSMTSNNSLNSGISAYSSAQTTLTDLVYGLSFSFWVWLNASNANGETRIWECGPNTTDTYFIGIAQNTLDVKFCNLGTGYAVTANAWHHIACTMDTSGNGKMYVNGVERSSFSGFTYKNSIGVFNIPRPSTNGLYYSLNGFLDDFKVYSGIFTLEQVGIIYAGNDQ